MAAMIEDALSPHPPAWQPLQAGDSVYLIAPSTPADQGTVLFASEIVNSIGLNAVASPEISHKHHLWANTASHRADQIIQALYTPGVKAIYSLEGGEGASEVVVELKKREAELLNAPNRGIPLIGYSDTTFLHHYLGERGIVSPVQGPVPSYIATNDKHVVYEDGKLVHKENIIDQDVLVSKARSPEKLAAAQKNLAAFKDFLMGDGDNEPPITLHALNDAAKNSPAIGGTLVGGCDQPLAMARYVTHGPNSALHAVDDDAILLLEGKSLPEMRDTLTLLRDSGDLSHYKAIVLSGYYANLDADTPLTEGENNPLTNGKAAAILKEVGVPETLPVYFGAPIGHPLHGEAEIRPMPLYTKTVIKPNGADAQAIMTIDRHGDKQKLNTRALSNLCPASEHLHPGSNIVNFSMLKLSPVQGALPSMREHVPIAGGVVTFEQSLEKSVAQIGAQPMNGKHVILHFNLKEKQTEFPLGAVNPVHFVLMPLIASGDLTNAASITVSANTEFSKEFKDWLKEFSAEHLPGKNVHTTVLDGASLPEQFSGQVAYMKGNTPTPGFIDTILAQGPSQAFSDFSNYMLSGWNR